LPVTRTSSKDQSAMKSPVNSPVKTPINPDVKCGNELTDSQFPNPSKYWLI
jgi:hypothetical protein